MKEIISRLTWVDYLTFIAVLRGCYVGYKSGLFPELLRIAAYVISAVVTFRFHETLAQVVTLKTFLNLTSATAVSFLVLLAVMFAVTKLITMLILKLLKVGEGGFAYRVIGSVIGVCRWLILLSLIFMLIDYLPLSMLKEDIHKKSYVGHQVSQVGPVIFDFLSKLSPQLAVPKKTV